MSCNDMGYKRTKVKFWLPAFNLTTANLLMRGSERKKGTFQLKHENGGTELADAIVLLLVTLDI